MRLGTRFGADYTFLEKGPPQLYGGVDALTGYDRFLNEDRTYRVELAPLFGILVSITPNISVSTKPRLVGRYT